MRRASSCLRACVAAGDVCVVRRRPCLTRPLRHARSAEIAAYPNITIALSGNVVLDIPPQAYLVFNSPLAPRGFVCNGVQASTMSIIGDVAMAPYYVVFDSRQAQTRIGWAPVNSAACGRGAMDG